MNKFLTVFFISSFITSLITADAWAHKTSDSYLSIDLDSSTLRGEWKIPLVVLDTLKGQQLQIDQNTDDEITWGELVVSEKAIRNDVFSQLTFMQSGRSCDVLHDPIQLDQLDREIYLFLKFDVVCKRKVDIEDTTINRDYTLNYRLFFDSDPSHRGYLTYSNGLDHRNFVFSPNSPSVSLSSLVQEGTVSFWQFLQQGVWHIWIGVDHLLFLLALLIPSVFVFEGQKRRVQQRFKLVLFDILKVVTGFTIAHSITLSLATLKIVSLPDRLVETVIALSVVFTGCIIFSAALHRYRWHIAGIFGLIHGFGFANVLTELNQTGSFYALSLFAFNFGVELGQLAVVSLVLPVLFLLKEHPIYLRFIMPVSAFFMICFGSIWLLERGLGLVLI